MPNKYLCSNGEKVTEATIQSKLSKAYKDHYLFEPRGACEGCGETATCTAHIIPKARCKQIGKTELIWKPVNWFRSCYKCNAIAENPKSDEIKELLNYQTILKVTKQYDTERYRKFTS